MSRRWFIPSIRGHEPAAEAARLQQAHFMPASPADSQASEGYGMRSRLRRALQGLLDDAPYGDTRTWDRSEGTPGHG